MGSNVCIGDNGISEQKVTQINGINIAENVGIIGKSMGKTAKGKMLIYVNCK